MASYSSSDFKNGLKVLIDGEPFNIIDTEFHKPGKGQAFNKIKLKNLKNGKVLEKTIKIGSSLEKADVLTREMQFLYSDGDQFHFMDSESYEQIAISKETIGEIKIWLKEESVCNITLWNERAIDVEPPIFIESRIIKTDPGLKGDTAQGGVKPAEIETGANIKVPLFVDEGEIIKVDTRTGEYVSRVKRD
ncbi:MAG: elongation factor P [Gammaproteobacteria bacterium]|jgi:elongation factor P|nr:elongation factor P [Gammaproteobacteria bacterium]